MFVILILFTSSRAIVEIIRLHVYESRLIISIVPNCRKKEIGVLLFKENSIITNVYLLCAISTQYNI